MKRWRRPPLQHPLAQAFARAIESLCTALTPGSTRQYDFVVRNQQLGTKQFRDLLISGLLSKQLERCPLGVTRFAQSWETVQESCNPFDLASSDSMCKVIQFNCEESAHFSQVFDRPPRRSCPELRVSGIDIRALSH